MTYLPLIVSVLLIRGANRTMTPERIAQLQFQAEHNGLTQQAHARITKEGKNLTENGSTIQVTPAEMRELLQALKS